MSNTTPDISTRIESTIRKSVQGLYASTSLLKINEFKNLGNDWVQRYSQNRLFNGVNVPTGGVHAIKDRHDERRVIHLQALIQANNLEHSRHGQQKERPKHRKMNELVSGILVGQTPTDEFDAM